MMICQIKVARKKVLPLNQQRKQLLQRQDATKTRLEYGGETILLKEITSTVSIFQYKSSQAPDQDSKESQDMIIERDAKFVQKKVVFSVISVEYFYVFPKPRNPCNLPLVLAFILFIALKTLMSD